MIEGAAELTPLVGTAWLLGGLHVVSRQGHLASCPGSVVGKDTWRCDLLHKGTLPLSAGEAIAAAAMTQGPGPRPGLVAAFTYEGSPNVVALFAGGTTYDEWHPFGEIHLKPGAQPNGATSLAFANHQELIITTQDGKVHRRSLGSNAASTHAVQYPISTAFEWQAACSTSDHLSLLALRPASDGAWRPALFLAQ